MDIPTPTPIHSGGCLCGSVRFTLRGEPIGGNHCHCAMCRKESGAGVSTFVTVATTDLDWHSHPAEYESSPGRFRGFCPRCGSSLTWRHGDRVQSIDLRLGSFDDPTPFKSRKHLWTSAALPEFAGLDPDIPHFKTSTS